MSERWPQTLSGGNTETALLVNGEPEWDLRAVTEASPLPRRRLPHCTATMAPLPQPDDHGHDGDERQPPQQGGNMAGKRYTVVRYDRDSITIAPIGSIARLLTRPGITDIRITRTAITTTNREAGKILVATSDGRRYEILPGVRGEQRQLTFDALGIAG